MSEVDLSVSRDTQPAEVDLLVSRDTQPAPVINVITPLERETIRRSCGGLCRC